MSPVPGGRSSRSTSRSPHHTSARNCCRARCSIGPRQVTGWVTPPGLNGSIEITRTPWPVGGMIRPSIIVGFPVAASIRGMLWP